MQNVAIFALAALIAAPTPAVAQRFAFERPLVLTGTATLDVSTLRGKIEVTVGEPGRMVVAGAATVRAGWDVPANAEELARRVASSPPIERDGNTVRLRPPADSTERRAITINYRVRVPPTTQILAVSDSGAIAIEGALDRVTVRTQSGAIDVVNVGSTANVTTGSGGVTIDGVRGDVEVTTSSSSILAHKLGGSLRVRTSSGAVEAELVGNGDVDIETSSSGVQLRGLKGGMKVISSSGRITAHGMPSRPWQASTGSGAVDIAVAAGTAFTVNATSGSGSVLVKGAPLQGAVSKRKVAGTVGGGGPIIHLSSRSGAIRVTVGTERSSN
jgi:hypothetical protein